MKIGIVGTVFENTFGVRKTYMEWIDKLFPEANIVVLAPDSFEKDLNLLILPGGRDLIDSKKKPSYFDGHADPWFEYFDEHLLPQYIDAGTPIFGVCRGFQALCHSFGLKVIHHLPYHPFSQERTDEVHHILIPPEARNLLELDYSFLKVNSLHHQGISVNSATPEGFVVVGRDYYPSTKNRKEAIMGKLIEAFVIPEKGIAGVQWHPEEIDDDLSRQLLIEIIKKNDV